MMRLLKSTAKSSANAICLVVTWPGAACSQLENLLLPDREGVYLLWAQAFSLIPGSIGVYLRRAYYRQTLHSCAADAFIGFGALFTHRDAEVEESVYIGHYALIGSARLCKRCLIGSRASLLSGGHLHVLEANGEWSDTDHSRRTQIEIGENAWLGEATVVMANVGAGSMVAAGAVVSSSVPTSVMVAGNPARFVKRLSADHLESDEQDTPSNLQPDGQS